MHICEARVDHQRFQLRRYPRVLSHLEQFLAIPIPPPAQERSISTTIGLKNGVKFDHLEPAIGLQQCIQLANIRLPAIGIDAIYEHATVDEVERFRPESVAAGILSQRNVQVPPLSNEGLDAITVLVVLLILVLVGVTLPGEEVDPNYHSVRPVA